MPGTYTSEPALTYLGVNVGNLAPSFHKNRFAYVVQEVPDETEQVTVTATARAGNAIKFVDGHGEVSITDCGSIRCQYEYEDGDGNKLEVLQDADEDAPGFQINLKENGASFMIHAHPYDWGHAYKVRVVRGTPNSPATGLPTISGTVQVGQTLTAGTSGVADEDGLDNATFSYQWLSSKDTEIQGATNSTYTLADADEGKAIQVRVTFTDDAGNEESLTSAATAAVAAAPPPPPDNVRAVTQKSSAVELTWDAPQDATVTGYRIERRLAGGDRSDQQRSVGSHRDDHTLVEGHRQAPTPAIPIRARKRASSTSTG